LREESRQRVFKNMVLWRMFGGMGRDNRGAEKDIRGA
jgi:hypothetical protein